MSDILATVALAFGLLVLALLGMGISYFFRKKCLKKQCDVNPDSCSCKMKDLKKKQDEEQNP